MMIIIKLINCILYAFVVCKKKTIDEAYLIPSPGIRTWYLIIIIIIKDNILYNVIIVILGKMNFNIKKYTKIKTNYVLIRFLKQCLIAYIKSKTLSHRG